MTRLMLDVSAVWDTAYINGSCATSSCAQHEAWIGASGSMDNTATIEPSHASCYGSMTVSAQGSLIGQASMSSIASVHNSESSSCTVDPASRIFAQMDDCLPMVVAGPRVWEHVQLPPPHASSPEVLPASPSGLRPCISASGHGIGRRKHVSFGFTVAFWFPSASQLQLPRPPLCSDDDACSAAPCFAPLEQEAASQVKQVRHVGLRLPTNCPDLASGPGYTQARHVGIRPPCSSTCLDSSLSHHRQSGASEESCAAFSVPQAEHVGFRSPGFVTQASPPQVAAPLGSALSPWVMACPSQGFCEAFADTTAGRGGHRGPDRVAVQPGSQCQMLQVRHVGLRLPARSNGSVVAPACNTAWHVGFCPPGLDIGTVFSLLQPSTLELLWDSPLALFTRQAEQVEMSLLRTGGCAFDLGSVAAPRGFVSLFRADALSTLAQAVAGISPACSPFSTGSLSTSESGSQVPQATQVRPCYYELFAARDAPL